jgi:hypothetical protein
MLVKGWIRLSQSEHCITGGLRIKNVANNLVSELADSIILYKPGFARLLKQVIQTVYKFGTPLLCL